ncbi:hypothetical protein B296_00006173 [Ensete ventricosum]|uniref:Uncharacterized protein n=1 Tax=Ensete ventricosum TaxID=4639 RepID=A0A426Z938_ENSVE|nr:hypothetical protein B296_00006173 [Ensete ventricosum]
MAIVEDVNKMQMAVEGGWRESRRQQPVTRSCSDGSREVQRQGRSWKWLWQRGQQWQGRRQRRLATDGSVMATGKRLGSTGSGAWQRQWWRCRGRQARLRARNARDVVVAVARRRRQGRKGRTRDGKGGYGRGAGALRQQAGEGYRRPAGGSSDKSSALPKAGRRQMRRGGIEVVDDTVVAGRRKIKLRLLSRRRGGDDSDWRQRGWRNAIGSRKQRWCRYASVPKKELPAVASAEALVRVSWVGLRLMSLSVEKSGWRQ